MITDIVKEIEDIATNIRYSHVERVNKTIDKIKQYKILCQKKKQF